jgi:uncharacterized repeat protein (TIGR01451 family)
VETATSVVTVTEEPVNTWTAAKFDDLDPVGPGEPLVYTIHIQNTGRITATAVEVIEHYPEAFEFQWAEPQPTIEDNTWELAAVPPGKSYTILVGGQVNPTVLPGTVLVNEVALTAAEFPALDVTEETLVTWIIPGDQSRKLRR